MLLNVPPNNQGTVDQPILNRVKEFGENVEETFRTNLAKAKEPQLRHLMFVEMIQRLNREM